MFRSVEQRYISLFTFHAASDHPAILGAQPIAECCISNYLTGKMVMADEHECLYHGYMTWKHIPLLCHHTNQTRFDYPNPSLV